MKVLLVTNDFPPIRGGISAVAVSLVRAMKSFEHDVYAIVPRTSLDALAQEDLSGKAYRGYSRMITRVPSVHLCLLAALIRWRPDVVMGMNVSYVGPLMSLLPTRGRPRCVLAAFGYEFLKWPNVEAFQRLLKFSYGGADAIFTVSDHMKDRLVARGVPSAKILTLHICPPRLPEVEESEIDHMCATWNPGRLLLLTVARLVRRKGVDLVLNAMVPLISEFQDLRYWIVGDGPERCRLEILSRDLGIESHVSFLGEIDDRSLSACYRAADLFVMTPVALEESGDVEGLGLTYIEACRAGLPCVGSWSGGVPEAVEDGVNGRLIPDGDVSSLTQVLRELIADEALRRDLGKAGSIRAETVFSREKMLSDLARLLGETTVCHG